jgi:hypothetical protein
LSGEDDVKASACPFTLDVYNTKTWSSSDVAATCPAMPPGAARLVCPMALKRDEVEAKENLPTRFSE